MGRLFILIGAILLLIGLVLTFAPGLLNWFGRLPGDIRIETERTRVYIPITTMLLVSVALSLLLNLLKR